MVGKYARAIRRIASRHRRTAAYSSVVAIYSCPSPSRGIRARLRLVIPYCTEAATARYAAGCRATRAGCRYVVVKAGSHQLPRLPLIQAGVLGRTISGGDTLACPNGLSVRPPSYLFTLRDPTAVLRLGFLKFSGHVDSRVSAHGRIIVQHIIKAILIRPRYAEWQWFPDKHRLCETFRVLCCIHFYLNKSTLRN